MLHGRDVERARLVALTEGARQGRAGALVVRGEPGIGKSALLDDLAGTATDQGLRVLRTQGLESESPLAFGALHRLLRPLTQLIDQLPAPQALGDLGNAALHLGDNQAAERSYSVMLSIARESGAGMSVIYALQRLAFTQFVAGRWDDVRASAEEALSLSRSVGQQALAAAPLAWLTLLAAHQGRPDYDYRLSEVEDVQASQPLGILTDPVHDLVQWALGVRATHAGDLSAAVHHLARLRLPTLIQMAAVDRLEAASRAGDLGHVAAWAEELAPFATGSGWPWALRAVDYGRALTADTAEATAENFERALACHSRKTPGPGEGLPIVGGGRPYDRARVQLAYGEWLRRNQRRVDARTHLRAALETFHDLNAAPMIARATEELRASGESARKRDPSTLLQLTPTELKVAQLVSSGLSNKDVAAQCWISPRTVAFHLRNVFAKTGVTSRGELAQLSLKGVGTLDTSSVV